MFKRQMTTIRCPHCTANLLVEYPLWHVTNHVLFCSIIAPTDETVCPKCGTGIRPILAGPECKLTWAWIEAPATEAKVVLPTAAVN